MTPDLPLPNPTPTRYEGGYAHSLPIPGHEGVDGMYHPECDTLYLRSSDFDYEDGSFGDLTVLDQEMVEDISAGAVQKSGDLDLTTVLDEFLPQQDDMEVANHELGHAILTKQSFTRNPTIVQNVVGILQFSDMLRSSELSDELLVRAGMHQLATERKQILDKNLTRPVHEAYARIVQAYRADASTQERLRKQLGDINEHVSDWSLKHPGYDPITHSSPEHRQSWTQYLCSYERSVLSGAVDLFIALDDDLAYRLLTTAASSAIHLYLTSPDDITESTARGIPAIVFANGVVSLHKDRNELSTLADAGVDHQTIIQVFSESIGFGSIGLESVEEKLRQRFVDQVNGEVRIELLQQIQHQIHSTTLPSMILIEDDETNTIHPIHNPKGLDPWIIFLTLLRWTFIDSIYRESEQFTESFYTSLLEDLQQEVEAEKIVDSQGLITRARKRFDEVVDTTDCETVQSKAANYYRQQLHESGLDEIAGELAVPDKKSRVLVSPEQHLPKHLEVLAQLPAGEGRFAVENVDMMTRELFQSWSETTIETFLGSVIANIANYTGVDPSTPRLTRLRGLMQQIAMDQDDPEQFLGTVYGHAVGQVFPAVDSTNPVAWITRLNDDVQEILNTEAFGETCYSAYGRNVMLTYVRKRQTQSANVTVVPSKYHDELMALLSTLATTESVTEIEIGPFPGLLITVADQIVDTLEGKGVQWVEEIIKSLVVTVSKMEQIESAIPPLVGVTVGAIMGREPAACASVLKVVERCGEEYSNIVDIDAYYHSLSDSLYRMDSEQTIERWLPVLLARYAAICE